MVAVVCAVTKGDIKAFGSASRWERRSRSRPRVSGRSRLLVREPGEVPQCSREPEAGRCSAVLPYLRSDWAKTVYCTRCLRSQPQVRVPLQAQQVRGDARSRLRKSRGGGDQRRRCPSALKDEGRTRRV